MTETQQILLTAGATVAGGVIVVVIGQALIRFVLEPLQELRKEIVRAASTLVYWAHVYTNPGKREPEALREVSSILREQSVALRVKAHALPMYSLFIDMGAVPSKQDIERASSSLMGLSNGVYADGNARENYEEAKAAFTHLGFPQWCREFDG